MTAPFSLPNSPERDRHGVVEGGGDVGKKKDERGASFEGERGELKMAGVWGGKKGGKMKKANLPVRAEEWENEREGSGIEREREEERRGNSVGASSRMRKGN